MKNLFQAIIPEHREIVNERIMESIDHKINYNMEYQITWPDGSIHWIQANGTPYYDPDGKPVRMIGITQLITDKKNYQAKKDEFLSVAIHELKTPITVLKANLQLIDKLKSKVGDSTVVKLLDSCNRSMEKINVMLADLLDMGKYSDGKITLNVSTFNIQELLHNSIQHLTPDQKDLIRIDSPPIQLSADELRLEQVVINLVNNAVKYAANTYEIIVSAKITNHMVRVSVKDFGNGIAPGDLHKVFDRYWQANKKEDSSKGLGLGLYICSDIIQKHGGHIGVESEVGEGSEFWFEIPQKN